MTFAERLKSERGLTLVEIIVVLIILSLVMTFVGGKILGAGDTTKAELTRTMLKDMQMSIEQFRLRYNQLPSSLEALTQCNDVTGPGCSPIRKADSLKDAWGNKFVYQSDGSTYRIKTLGADGKEGGEEVNFDNFVAGP
ncbi:MAG: type II secretion system protein GspG [Deltaproteobacteria bacterium]|nr:type II secretion system protein GspG [Deltaproteobacteria bacterium]